MTAPFRTLLLCTALIGAAGVAQAQTTAPATGLTRAEIEAAYADYERIEIAFGPTQVKVEAIDAQTGQVVEAIYDRATGAILKEETGTFSGTVTTGIEVRDRPRDFLRPRANDDTPGDTDTTDETVETENHGDSDRHSSTQSPETDRGRGRGRSEDSAPDDATSGREAAGRDASSGRRRGGWDDDSDSGDDN